MMTDPISDMLARIRNAATAHHDRIDLPHSNVKESIGRVLKSEGFVDDVRVSDGEGTRTLTLVLRYGRNREAAIDGMRRISTPGRRVYVGHDSIPRVRSGLGVSILSNLRKFIRLDSPIGHP